MNNILSFLVLTLGCKLNQLESESLTGAFIQAGFILCKEQSTIGRPAGLPSIVIINTCTVTSKADQKARRVIRKALRDYPDSCVIVTGCYAQLNKDDLLNLDLSKKQRLFVIDKNSILQLPDNINKTSDFFEAVRNWKTSINHSSFFASNSFQFNPERFSSHTRSFLKIQDGCDKHCTYCRIRLARGPSISLDAGQVLARLRILEENYAEAVLTGVNICQYRSPVMSHVCEEANNLAELLDYLLCGTKTISLRLSSLAPESIDEKLTSVFSNKRIRPHFHLSIQSGSEKILEKMGRSYNGETIKRAIAMLRGAKDDPFIACDIITGFHGETEEEFLKTYELCQKAGFSWIHVFPYSKRPDTPAFSFKDNVTESEVSKRVQIFTDLAKQGKAEYVRRCLGREVDLLIENEKKTTAELYRKSGKEGDIGYCGGVSENYLKLLVRYNIKKALLPGTILRCKLLEECNLKNYDAVAVYIS